MTDLESLATRLEQAGPERQAELLREAYEAIFGFSPEHDEWYGIEPEQRAQGRYFTAMLDCGAYLSAAGMLVPSQHDDYMVNAQNGSVQVHFYRDGDGVIGRGDASTECMARAAACVRAAIAGPLLQGRKAR